MGKSKRLKKMLRSKDVQKLTGVSHGTLMTMVNKGEFPAPVKITNKLLGWEQDRVREWKEKDSKNITHGKGILEIPLVEDNNLLELSKKIIVKKEKVILDKISSFLKQYELKFSLFHDGDFIGPTVWNPFGFREIKDGITFYYVFPEPFQKKVCAGLDFGEVCAVLSKMGWLCRDGDGNLFKWNYFKNVGKRRCYIFNSKMWESIMVEHKEDTSSNNTDANDTILTFSEKLSLGEIYQEAFKKGYESGKKETVTLSGYVTGTPEIDKEYLNDGNTFLLEMTQFTEQFFNLMKNGLLYSCVEKMRIIEKAFLKNLICFPGSFKKIPDSFDESFLYYYDHKTIFLFFSTVYKKYPYYNSILTSMELLNKLKINIKSQDPFIIQCLETFLNEPNTPNNPDNPILRADSIQELISILEKARILRRIFFLEPLDNKKEGL